MKREILNTNMHNKPIQTFLSEMPQHYPGNVTYQKDGKFVPISVRNISDYVIIGENGGLAYMVDPGQTTGYVFDIKDLRDDRAHQIIPIMTVALRSTDVGFKQAHHLRIREAHSKNNIASFWYDSYVKVFKGIVSDAEHLEGGKALWKSFIKKSFSNPRVSVYLVDSETGRKTPISQNFSDEEIWSKDASKKNQLIAYTLK